MRHDIIKVFLGYDPVETVAWHVMAHSIFRQSSCPVAIVPVDIRNFEGFFHRERDPKQSNEFSFSRFLVPYLSDYKGYGIYFDCDMLLRCDVAEIFESVKQDPDKAVYVVKHDYRPREDVKYLDTRQYSYPRKNWSSVVIWNCAHPAHKKLTPEFVQTASGLQLHRFTWLQDDQIGELDVRWNWLVGEYVQPPAEVKNVHWTLGGPFFDEYRNSDFSEEWFEELARINFCAQRRR
jgi:lipopolysaccharide biosynthesis glycosyltransferase